MKMFDNDSVETSVGFLVYYSIYNLVNDSVCASVQNSVRNLVNDSVWVLVYDPVRAFIWILGRSQVRVSVQSFTKDQL